MLGVPLWKHAEPPLQCFLSLPSLFLSRGCRVFPGLFSAQQGPWEAKTGVGKDPAPIIFSPGYKDHSTEKPAPPRTGKQSVYSSLDPVSLIRPTTQIFLSLRLLPSGKLESAYQLLGLHFSTHSIVFSVQKRLPLPQFPQP